MHHSHVFSAICRKGFAIQRSPPIIKVQLLNIEFFFRRIFTGIQKLHTWRQGAMLARPPSSEMRVKGQAPFFSSTLAPPEIIRTHFFLPWPHKRTQFFLHCPPSLKKILRQAYILHTSHHAQVRATVIFNVGLTIVLCSACK